MTFRDYMQRVDDKVLMKSFDELQESRNTGVLTAGVTRELLNKYNAIFGFKASLKDIEREVFYEMATRYYAIRCK